jgi:MFS family permease
MLAAFAHRNFRLYFAAQVGSTIGTWIQIIVENWLVLELSHSGLALALTNALQFGPAVMLGMYGGVIADRHDRRRLLMLTQAALGALALAVGVLAAIGIVRVWIIWLAAFGLGLVKCFDMPALQGFVKDLVGPADLPNAVAWTNAINATGRMVGPIFGGLVLATLGPAPGFLVNAASFAFVLLMLSMLRSQELSPRTLAPSERGQIRQGLRYIRNDPVLAATCLIMLIIFIAAFNFQIALALVTSNMVAGNSQTYGTLMSTLGFGAATGSLILARHPRVGLPPTLLYTALLAIAQLAVAAAHTVPLALAASFAYGLGAALFSVTVISTLQTRTAEDMRGRVMALYSICFLGSSPIGGPGFAALASWIGISRALCITAAICAATTIIAAVAWRTRISLQKQGNPALSVD